MPLLCDPYVSVRSDDECAVSSHIFPAIKYRAIDYVCEAAINHKMTMNVLALPIPYNLVNNDLYPHTGNPPEVTYREPWIRGNVISTCKLSVSGSVLADLGTNGGLTDSLEKLNVRVIQVNAVDVIPSSNPSSQVLDIDDAYWLLQETTNQGISLCHEVFSKSTEELTDQRQNSDDLLMPEEVLFVDCLPQFRKHLPTLRTKLARLRTLPVLDPLLSPRGSHLSEDTILRHCADCEVSLDEETESSKTHPSSEVFSKEILLIEESLMMPVEMDIFTLKTNDWVSFPNTRDVLNVTLELMDDQIPCLDLLSAVTPSDMVSSVDICQYEVPREPNTSCHCEKNNTIPDYRLQGYLMLPSELEMDLPLTPSTGTIPQICLSSAQLPAEQLSPVYRKSVAYSQRYNQAGVTEPVWIDVEIDTTKISVQSCLHGSSDCYSCLVSERDQEEMEQALWMAEKHPHLVLGFLLKEPLLSESAVQFQPLAEALKLLTMGQLSSVSEEMDESLQPPVSRALFEGCLTGCPDFTERMCSDRPHEVEVVSTKIETFTPLSPCQMDYILTESIKESEAPVPPIEVKVQSIPKTAQSHQEITASADVVVTGETATTFNDNDNFGNKALSVAPSCRSGNTAGSSLAVWKTLREKSNQPIRTERMDDIQPVQSAKVPRPSPIPRVCVKDNQRNGPVTTPLPQEDLDPLSSFMMLRSQQRAHVPVAPKSYASTPVPKVSQTPQPSVIAQEAGPDTKPANVRPAVTGSEIRVQETTNPLPVPEDKHDSRVIQVQATESQWVAFSELRTMAQAWLSEAGELGLNTSACGDFLHLAPDHTRFLLKQQEKDLSVRPGHGEEQLYNQVAIIHVLVTVKDLLLRCDLTTAVEFLCRACEACAGRSLEQLARKLQVLQYLSQRNQEPNPKILELQEHMSAWLQTGQAHHSASKVLVILTMDSDWRRDMIIRGLSQVTGETVSALCPKESKRKLDEATVLKSLRGSVCVVVCSQHMGADFPWQCFSLVVEYDHTECSPWVSVCSQRNIRHLTFHTTIHNADTEPESWSLEEKVPYTLFVTEGLLNCPLLLHRLESSYNMTVLERRYSQSLERLGGTHHYAVVTVDESTAVIIQKQEELCHRRACESVVMRLTALSLQYSCCWLILHCPDCQGEGLTSEGFTNLVLVYSSLVLFGLKAEDLDVKVLIVPEVVDVAKWVCQIAFHSLMSSKTDTPSYLNRGAFSVMPSEEEKCLLAFPCVNPVVAQLMLSRAPSLQWLLGASLPQLQELLPEVPHKVIKLFSETTSLYKLTTDPSPPNPPVSGPQNDLRTPNALWMTDNHQQHTQAHPGAFKTPSHNNSFVPSSPCAGSVEGRFYLYEPVSATDDGAEFHVSLSHCFGSETSSVQGSWRSDNPWEEEEGDGGRFSGWSHGGGRGDSEGKWEGKRGGGRGGEREGRGGGGEEDWIRRAPTNHEVYSSQREPANQGTAKNPFQYDSSFSCSSRSQEPAFSNSPSFSFLHSHMDLQYPGSSHHHPLTPHCGPRQWVGRGGGSGSFYSAGQGRGGLVVSPPYGTHVRTGQERKRMADVAGMLSTVLTPLKRGKLSYEKVPGRSDGQTRLRFF